MKNLECIITDGKKKLAVHPSKMIVYLQGKIVEAFDKNDDVHYLLFFKEEYLTTLKVTSVRRRSFLEKAHKYGETYPAPHPFIHDLLSPDTTYQKRSLHQLRGKFQNQHTTQETALMLTFFDAFMSKKDLFEDIQSLYYQHRRSGQLFMGYRIIRVLMDFTPKHSWVKQLSNEMEFLTFKEMYQDLSDRLWEQDPIFMEKTLYFRRKQTENFQQLLHFFKEEKRWIDVLSLLMDYISRNGADAYYDEFVQWLDLYYSDEQKHLILEDLYSKSPHIEPLQRDLLQIHLSLHQLQKAMQLLKQHDMTLEDNQGEAFENMLENIDLSSGAIEVEQLNTYIAPLLETEPGKAEKILQKCMNQLLANRDITYISKWLEPIRQKSQKSPTVAQIDKMKKMREDPDKQLQLGEMYYNFNQLDQAIDCFSWEMELNKSDPQPVRWLSKIYLELGKKEESKAYQELYRNMQQQENA
ncbi:hypothetical protein D7Z54_27495 [Salibacterium salarium]|uniref:Uncharacterized protein n=1 Tax=Salibacterium salarium TaxID=284579 RepID=A0A3R9R993_9BACI|nr:hypothetical protein [Salibacterium salarium]RSL30129.1 hypothetical protein D7Z54_27495 [Salibacterium salarium]